MEAILIVAIVNFPANAGCMASLFHVAPYREPRKYEAGNQRDCAGRERRCHDAENLSIARLLDFNNNPMASAEHLSMATLWITTQCLCLIDKVPARW